MYCGARTRAGHRCRRQVQRGRCRIHGGRSTGPRTAEGLRRTVDALWHGRKRYIARRHALGLKAPGGRPSGRWWKRPVDERERTLRRMADLIEKLPAPPKKPIEQW